MEEKNQERCDIWSIYFFHILVFQCPICKRTLKAREKMAEHVRSHKLEKSVECTYPGCNAVIQNFKFKIRSLSNWNNFRPQQQNMHCNSMWSPITSPRRRNQQTYKFLACSKFEWIGVRAIQQKIPLSDLLWFVHNYGPKRNVYYYQLYFLFDDVSFIILLSNIKMMK